MFNYWQESVKMVLSKNSGNFFHQSGLAPSQILSALMAENIVTTRQTVARFVKRFSATGTIFRKEGSGRPSKITDRVLQLVEQRMREDDETTAVQLQRESCGCCPIPI